MIYTKELVKTSLWKLDPDHICNLINLHHKLNAIRAHYNKPIYINSGFRTFEDHKRIYLARGVVVPPLGSQHLIGAAADLQDRKGALKKWILDHLELSESLGLYYESFEATGGMDGGWIHAQLYPPKSGKRFFDP